MSQKEYKCISFDGASASGKSSLGRALAKKLSYGFLDSGSLYRAIAWQVLRIGIEVEESVLAPRLIDMIARIQIDGDHIVVSDHDLTKELQTEEISAVTPVIGAWKQTRELIREKQRLLASSQNIVMTGRDIGTTVLPNADIKFYIYATSYVRAVRRWLQYPENSRPSISNVEEAILARDAADVSREHSPMRIPDGAIVLDTTNLSFNHCLTLLYLHCIHESIPTV